MLAHALDGLLAFALLGALFVPLERAFAARAQAHLRPGVWVDLAFFALQYLVMISVLLAFNGWLQTIVPSVLSVRAWPLPLQALLALVLGDLLLYWSHRACHRVPLLWRFHRVHHS